VSAVERPVEPAAAVRPAEPEPAADARRTPGEGGIWVFILADMTVFALMFGALVLLQADDPARYELGQDHLHVGVGVANTIVLLGSSLAVALAVRHARAGALAPARRLFSVAFGCALLFWALKLYEYTSLGGDGVSARENEFFLYYFSFTGVHLLHVTLGLAGLAGVIRLTRRPVLSDHERSLVETGASYWHMVDLLWIVLFALLYLYG
jgi:nitric oxide reductase NorE protein